MNDLPGFRFHPTEEELLEFYLKNMVSGRKFRSDIIGYLCIYQHDPWDLPGMAKVGEREWYFFVPRDRKHGSGGRPNRTTKHGFWKATGSDRKIVSISEPKRFLGMRKTLVFYKGRAPRGSKTDWVMNEYRLPDSCNLPKDIVLCKIYRKATSLKVLEQRAAMEEEKKTMNLASTASSSSPPHSMETNLSFCSAAAAQEEMLVAAPKAPPLPSPAVLKKEQSDDMSLVTEESSYQDGDLKETKGSSLQLPFGLKDNLTDLQLPTGGSMDWNQYNIWFSSPNNIWLQNLTPTANFFNLFEITSETKL